MPIYWGNMGIQRLFCRRSVPKGLHKIGTAILPLYGNGTLLEEAGTVVELIASILSIPQAQNFKL